MSAAADPVPPVAVIVDGGGSKTRAAIAIGGRVVDEVEGPSTNPESVGLTVGAGNLVKLLDRLWEARSHAFGAIPSVTCLALSAASTPKSLERFMAAVRERGQACAPLCAPRCWLVNDIVPLLYTGASDQRIKAAVVCGTGTGFAARGADGSYGRASGLESVLADEGGAFDVAVRGFRAVVRAADGRGPETLLTKLCAEWGGPEPLGLYDRLRPNAAQKPAVARFARMVLQAAAARDPAAIGIIEDAARELEVGVRAVLRQVGAGVAEPVEVVASGSLLVGDAAAPLFESFRQRLRRAMPTATLVCMESTLPAVAALGAAIAADTANLERLPESLPARPLHGGGGPVEAAGVQTAPFEGAHIRRNPFEEEWIMYAPGRARIQSVTDPGYGRAAAETHLCPFCPGSDEVVREFDVLILPNRYPSFRAEPADVPEESGWRDAYGIQDVFVFDARHDAKLSDQTPTRIATLLDRLSARTLKLWAESRVQTVFSFENSGPIFGPSIAHPHGQTFALPFVPRRFVAHEELSCPVCAEVRQADDTLVAMGARTILCCPAHARFPYEMLIAPRDHVPLLSDLDEETVSELGVQLRTGLRALELVAGRDCPYMLLIYQAPKPLYDAYHLRFEIVPISKPGGGLKYLGGLELGAGVYVNPSVPERSASALRTAVVDEPDLALAVMQGTPH